MEVLQQLRALIALDEPLWISGGKTIRALLMHLPELREHTALQLTDERVVALDHPCRNERVLAELGLFVSGWGSHPRVSGRPQELAKAAIVGLGADGHIASCFPSQEQLWQTADVVHVSHPALEPLIPRVTITPQLLASCEQVFVVAHGPERHAKLPDCVYHMPNRVDACI